VFRQPPIKALPRDYREVYHLVLMEPGKLVTLNLLSLALAVPFVVLVIVWSGVVQALREPFPGSPEHWPDLLLWLGVLLVLPLHELVHGLAIRWVGHEPRYGAKYARLGPVSVPLVLYATADDAFFRRDQFIVVALAPLVGITLGGMLLMIVLPDFLGYYIGIALIINGAGAIGDLWMTAVTLRYPASALVRDEADSIRIYTQH
jgi:hypothetical protein